MYERRPAGRAGRCREKRSAEKMPIPAPRPLRLSTRVNSIERSQTRQNLKNRIVASFTVRSNLRPGKMSEIITHLAFYALN
jgi:hypothetical protein